MPLSYTDRRAACQHPMAQALLDIMEAKQTNLCVSADVTTQDALYTLTDAVGPHICLLKTHIDILTDFTPACTDRLSALAQKHRFLIFEDRKFADIGHTVSLQYEKGLYHIANWAHIINAHTLPGPGIIEGLKKVGLPKGNALLLLAEMSAKDNLLTPEYTQKTLILAEQHSDFVIGFISRQKITDRPHFLHFTPGVQWAAQGDGLGQQYITPEEALVDRKTDIIIVGRGIYADKNPENAAATYRAAGWQAYQKRLGKLSCRRAS